MNYRIKCSLLILINIYGLQNIKAQTQEQRNAIIATYDNNLLNNLYDNFHSDYLINYNLGVQFLTNLNLPVSGIDADGNTYSLKGFDSELNNVIYYKAFNNTATKSSIQTARVQKLHNGNAIGYAIKGQEMILGIWDGGQPLADHQNLGVNRVINKDGQFTTGSNANLIQNGINHATHVSGTMIGNGNNQIFSRGIAPEGKIWANTWDNDLSEMTLEAAEGLLISNHSYGINNRSYVNLPGFFGRYSIPSRAIDELIFNADMYVPVYAAGNDRAGIYIGGNLVQLNQAKLGFDLLTNETVGKNPVVVAAVYGVTNYILEANGTNNVEMSVFSQWGPTDDFRIKPDISSKGINVYSSTGTGVSNYSTLSGTSMATPAVTAVFSLWQQIHNKYWPTANNNSGFMKAASVKALMAHTADRAGEADGPDPKFGWGLINAEEGALILKKASENNLIFSELTIENYQTYQYDVVTSGMERLKATISWTDRPGNIVQIAESTDPVLINDLDIRVTRLSTNQVIYPWKLNKSWSNIYAYRGDNDVDPIEKIEYYDPISGVAPADVYRITITHKKELIGGNQNFSLIISGGIVSYNLNLDNDIFNINEVKLFPNPTSDFVNITDVDFDSIELYDITGKKITINSVNQEGQFTQLNVSNIATGIYLLNLMKGGKTKTLRFVKQ